MIGGPFGRWEAKMEYCNAAATADEHGQVFRWLGTDAEFLAFLEDVAAVGMLVDVACAQFGREQPQLTITQRVRRGARQHRTSERSLWYITKLRRLASPELFELVTSGRVSVMAALAVAERYDEDAQREIAAQGPEAVRAVRRRARREITHQSATEQLQRLVTSVRDHAMTTRDAGDWRQSWIREAVEFLRETYRDIDDERDHCNVAARETA